jgi:hypothetical protein
MIVSTKKPRQTAYAPDDERFLEMIPAIQRYARSAFRNLRSQAREEAVCAVVADAFFAFRRLVELGKQDRAYATPLARFAVRRYWAGRCAGMTRGRDLTSQKARTTYGIIIERLDKLDHQTRNWRQALVEDHRATPADIAAARIDVAAWLRSLTRRNRRIAVTLALGNTSSETARQFGVSRARISQLRSELQASWQAFQGASRNVLHEA